MTLWCRLLTADLALSVRHHNLGTSAQPTNPRKVLMNVLASRGSNCPAPSPRNGVSNDGR